MKQFSHLAIFGIFLGSVFVLLFTSAQGKFSKYHQSDIHQGKLSSINPPAGRTGAPGESNCTSCHSGTVQSSTGIIDVTFSGAGNEYIIGEDYTFTISISSGAKNGFQATILDNTNTKAGIFNSGTNYGTTTFNSRQYARQTVSSGITSWTINWTAPETDKGDLTFYFSFNKSNNANNSGGDIIYVGQYTISSAQFNTITNYEKENEKVDIVYLPLTNSLQYSFHNLTESEVMIQLHDLSGKLIYNETKGVYNSGNHKESIELNQTLNSGIYIASIFINNNVYSRKISIP